MLKTKVGLEAEYLQFNAKGDIVMPTSKLRDDFPVLGEIRATEGENMAETVANFRLAHLQTMSGLPKGHTIKFVDKQKLPLLIYKKACQEVTVPKNAAIDKVKNVHGIDMSDFSDQILKAGKIQGAYVSCGLHIHFSCIDKQTITHKTPSYVSVELPMAIGAGGLQQSLHLWRRDGYLADQEVSAQASVLTRPVIEWIVTQMDKKFFTRFAPVKAERTKYRQPGFFELKPYGFEYRSLPCNKEVLSALPEIINDCFDMVNGLNRW